MLSQQREQERGQRVSLLFTKAMMYGIRCWILARRYNKRINLANKAFLQLDDMRVEVSRREQEIMQMATKMKTLEEQHQDYQKHIAVLKESLCAKEEHYTMLQTDVSSAHHMANRKVKEGGLKAPETAAAPHRKVPPQCCAIICHFKSATLFIKTARQLLFFSSSSCDEVRIRCGSAFTSGASSSVSSVATRDPAPP